MLYPFLLKEKFMPARIPIGAALSPHPDSIIFARYLFGFRQST